MFVFIDFWRVPISVRASEAKERANGRDTESAKLRGHAECERRGGPTCKLDWLFLRGLSLKKGFCVVDSVLGALVGKPCEAPLEPPPPRE